MSLNPVRAGIATKPEDSRIHFHRRSSIDALNQQQSTAPCLHPFIGHEKPLKKRDGIPFGLMDYLNIDWTARQFSPIKHR
ncbi:hypothetical protein [Vibrio neptunius]|uniref:hypothetical protein n=1 Tax=Vibrio neptunius TaxID=170651 RepID=UPI003CE51C23